MTTDREKLVEDVAEVLVHNGGKTLLGMRARAKAERIIALIERTHALVPVEASAPAIEAIARKARILSWDALQAFHAIIAYHRKTEAQDG